MSNKAKLILEQSKAFKESVDVFYGFCRGKYNLSIEDDLNIGLSFLFNEEYAYAQKWFNLCTQRSSASQEIYNLIKSYIENSDLSNFKLKKEQLVNKKISYEQLIQLLAQFYISIKNNELDQYCQYTTTELGIPFSIISNEFRKRVPELNSDKFLLVCIHKSNESKYKLQFSFLKDVILRYVKLYKFKPHHLLKDDIYFYRELNSDLMIKICQILIGKNYLNDVKYFIPNKDLKNRHLLLSAKFLSLVGRHDEAVHHANQYLNHQKNELDSDFIGLISKSYLSVLGPKKSIELIDTILYEPLKNNLLLLKAQITADYFSYTNALSILEPYTNDPNFLVKYLEIKAQLPLTDQLKTEIIQDYHTSLQTHKGKNLYLASSYFDFCLKILDVKSAIPLADQVLAINNNYFDRAKKKAIEVRVFEKVKCEKTIIILKKLLNNPTMDLHTLIWASEELMKLGEFEYIHDFLQEYHFPKILPNGLFSKLRNFLLSLGLKSKVNILDQNIEESFMNNDVFQLAINFASEGEYDSFSRVIKRCEELEFDKQEIKFSKIMSNIVGNKYKVSRDELYDFLITTNNPNFLQKCFYFIKNMSDFDLMIKLCDHILNQYPNHHKAKYFKASALVSNGNYKDANQLISTFGVSDFHKVHELKEWQLAYNNNLEKAKSLFYSRTKVKYYDYLHSSIKNIERLDSNEQPNKGEVVVFAVFKDEEARVHSYLKHYRSLGIKRFIIVDNDSTDNTVNILLGQKDVCLFSAKGNYISACYGMRWINYLADLYAKDNWRIVADADEFLVYPHYEKYNIEDVTEYLDSNGYEVVRGFMLDMIPEKLNDLKQYKEGDDPVMVSGFLDKTHRKIKLDIAPYASFVGGSRHRLLFQNTFFSRQPLCKSIMIKGGRGIVHTSANHYTSPAKVADFTSLFLHYKFLVDWQKRGNELADKIATGVYSGALKKYSEFSNSDQNSSLICEDTVRYEGSEQLISLGLMEPGSFGKVDEKN